MDCTFQIITGLVARFINEVDELSLEDLKLIRSLNHIILRNKFEIRDRRYVIHRGLEENYTYAYDFLSIIKPEYASHLEKSRVEGTITFPKARKMKYPVATSDYDYETGRSKMVVPRFNNLEDSYAMTHEIMHDSNMDPESLTQERDLFTEAISLLFEFLQEDYFASLSKRPLDYRKNKINDLNAILYKAVGIEYQLDLIEKYLENGIITEEIFKDIMKTRTKKEAKIGDDIFTSLFEKGILDIDMQQRYIYGILLATYIHDRIIEDPTKIKEAIELNESLNDTSIEEIFARFNLPLEVEEKHFVIPEETIKILEKSYVNELKRAGVK